MKTSARYLDPPVERYTNVAPTPLTYVCPACGGTSLGDECDLCSGACCVTEKVAQDYRAARGWDQPEPTFSPRPWVCLTAASVAFLLALDGSGHGRLACIVVSLVLFVAAWFVPRKGPRK